MSSHISELNVRVYYEDTDAGGIVYHARYLAFYERARTEYLRQHNYQQQQLLAQNIAFAVKKMTINYYAAARLDDLLTIESELLIVKKASLTFKQQIFNQDRLLINSAEVLIACINPELMKPIAIPQSIITELLPWKK